MIRSIVTRLRHAAQSRRLGSLGERSLIVKPELITGGRNIFLERRVRIWPHARIECIVDGTHNGTIRIGEGTKIQMYFHCAAAESVTIGRSVLIAGRVYISDHDHAWPGDWSDLVTAPIKIGDNCWLGEGCAVLKGVTLGDNCVVGTNAVVTRSAPAGSMLAGVPARVIKQYNPVNEKWERVEACERSAT